MSIHDQAQGGIAAPSYEIARLSPASRAVVRCGEDASGKVSAAIGLTLPRDACRAAVRDQLAALWLGPDEWLLLAPESENWAAPLMRNLDGIACSAVEVSDRQVAFAVVGGRAETILASGCPLDLDASAFPVGMCTRTLFHKAPVVLWRTDLDRFHLEVWRSFSAYVEALLTLAAAEA